LIAIAKMKRSNILKAMLELADLGNDKRLAQGLPPDQLANKVGLPTETMRRYLHDLASPQVRLLEQLSPSGAYRLSHERLIPALRQLAGIVLAEAEQTGRMFNRAYGDWVAGQRSRKLLLGGRRLSDVVKWRPQLYWGADRDDKETFLKRSLTSRIWRRAIHVSAQGMLTWKLVPPLTVLSTQMRPLWASTIPLQIASPSPALARDA
jgi:hypothetical protein